MSDWVTLSSNDPPLSVTALLGTARPNVDAGYGGWQEVARPRRAPLTVWVGSPALRLTLPLLLDEWRSGDTVEEAIDDLEALALPPVEGKAPPQVRISADGGMVPHTDRVWVIDTLAFEDGAIANSDGDRVRQPVTLGLLEYVADVRVQEDSAANLQRLKAAAAKTKAAGARKKRVASGAATKTAAAASLRSGEVAVSGQDLLTLAARELGDARRWVEIAQLNGIRDPRAVSFGQVVRLP